MISKIVLIWNVSYSFEVTFDWYWVDPILISYHAPKVNGIGSKLLFLQFSFFLWVTFNHCFGYLQPLEPSSIARASQPQVNATAATASADRLWDQESKVFRLEFTRTKNSFRLCKNCNKRDPFEIRAKTSRHFYPCQDWPIHRFAKPAEGFMVMDITDIIWETQQLKSTHPTQPD